MDDKYKLASDLVAEHGSVREAARQAGVSYSTFHGWFQKSLIQEGENVEIPLGGKIDDNNKITPLSENERLFKENWGPEECKEELVRVYKLNQERSISRSFFRLNSNISESTWNRYFGTFNEFRKQAGIVLSRHAHTLERQIAKHASKDTLRSLSIDKHNWSGLYERPSSKRFQTMLVCSDIHDKECDPFYRRLFLEACMRIQPEVVVLNGDIFDMPEFGKYDIDPRGWDVVGRIKWVHKFLAELRNICPDAEFVFIEGNHEFRFLRHLGEATPALKVILSDLHKMTIPELLGIQKFEINYVSRSDLSVYTESDIRNQVKANWHLFFDSIIGSHYPQYRQKGFGGFNGHHHKHIVWPVHNVLFGPTEWHQLGSGHWRKASYCDGEIWNNGFLAVHVDTIGKGNQFEYFDCSGDFCVMGGTFYKRKPTEFINGVK